MELEKSLPLWGPVSLAAFPRTHWPWQECDISVTAKEWDIRLLEPHTWFILLLTPKVAKNLTLKIKPKILIYNERWKAAYAKCSNAARLKISSLIQFCQEWQSSLHGETKCCNGNRTGSTRDANSILLHQQSEAEQRWERHVLWLWLRPGHASRKETQEHVWTMDCNSLYIFHWIVKYLHLVQTADNRQLVLPVSQVFGNLGMCSPGKKQERASKLSRYSDMIRPASSFNASGNVKEKNILSISRSP